MSKPLPEGLKSYFNGGESWSVDREQSWRMALRSAWIVVGILGAIALAEAIAIITMLPLKTAVPYTLLVDRQTGYVQALKPLDREMIAPDNALTRSFLAQYVIAREGFDIDSLKDDYRKVTLWSADEARDRYVADMQVGSPVSPLTRLPRRALVDVEIRGISSLSPNTTLVRFATRRSDAAGQGEPQHLWQAVINYRFAAASMSAADRLTNPLGFQVLRYRRDAEMAPVELATPAQQAMPLSTQQNAPLPSPSSSISTASNASAPVVAGPNGLGAARIGVTPSLGNRTATPLQPQRRAP
jgi:type IV secretion system protein VirB8